MKMMKFDYLETENSSMINHSNIIVSKLENWTASCVITGKLVAALRGQEEFLTADHSACLREGWTAVRRWRQSRAEEALTSALEGDPVLHAHRMR